MGAIEWRCSAQISPIRTGFGKLLRTHPENVADIDGSVFSHGDRMTPVQLAVVIPVRGPLIEDLALLIELENVAPVRWSRFEIAPINHIDIAVGADRYGPGAAEFGAFPFVEKRAVALEHLDARIRPVRHIDAPL